MLEDGPGIARVALRENMRMPPNQLVGDLAAHILDREAPLFARNLRMHHHLEQKVTQLFAQIRVVARPNRLGDFVGFLEQIWD